MLTVCYHILTLCVDVRPSYVQVRVLIAHVTDVNQADIEGYTPFFVACQEGRVEIVQLLIEHGVDVDLATDGGATPLFIACQEGHTDVMRIGTSTLTSSLTSSLTSTITASITSTL